MFSLFDFQHISVLAIVFAGIFCVRNNQAWKKILTYGLALQFVTYHSWNIYFGTWNIGQSLPFHLCTMAVFVNIFALNTTKNWVKELAFYWTILPVTLALLLPDLNTGVLSFRFWEFFWSHILMLWSAVLIVKSTKLTVLGLHRSFAIVVGYTLFFALPINLWLKTNYAYIVTSPAPVRDIFPVFPYFIPILMVILYTLYWIQFAFAKFFKKYE